MKKKKISFSDYYQEIYKERWPSLEQGMKGHELKVLRPTRNFVPKSWSDIFDLNPYHKEVDSNSSNQTYIMDPASIIAAKSLPIASNDFILDMCAAPGGKSLILLEQLGSQGKIWSNEISSARRHKLKSVIQEYVPTEKRENIFIKGKDGIKYGLTHPNTFDKILVDAPCSGERHLIQKPKELEKWSLNRTKRLAKTQYGLLCSALLSLKPGGYILYSTCSISPMENDEVIERLLTKKSTEVELAPIEETHEFVEKTKFGYIVLPDKTQTGPLYFTLLKKLNSD